MKTMLTQAIRLTLICLVVFSGLYTAIVWGMAQAVPGSGKGETVSGNGHTYYANIGQSFTQDKWFNSRPSAVDYNAAGSGGSNKGPSNPEYLAVVQGRIDTFLINNPEISKKDIPADMVTASASGLDPDISVAGAKIQIKRIAKARNIPQKKLISLIDDTTTKPLLGVLGPQKVNVLKLNLALQQLK
jgi:K+-transporting ATPase ATPase C chain